MNQKKLIYSNNQNEQKDIKYKNNKIETWVSEP